MPLLAFDYLTREYCHSVSSVRYAKHCVVGQPSEHSFVAGTRVVLFSRSTAWNFIAHLNPIVHILFL